MFKFRLREVFTFNYCLSVAQNKKLKKKDAKAKPKKWKLTVTF